MARTRQWIHFLGLVATFLTLSFSVAWPGVHTHLPRGINAANDTVEVDVGDVLIASKAKFDSAILVIKDTTVTGVSVFRMEEFNLHNPNQMWDYDQYRRQERNTSIVRSEGKTHPDWGVKIITAGQDSLVTVDGKDHSRPLVFVGGASNAILDATPVMTSISTQDGRDWISGTGGADWTLIDWMADQVYQWDTANYSQYKGTLTNRNAGSGWLALATSPVIVNASVNDGDVIRSPWPFHRDTWGRQLPYWEVPTAGGFSFSSYNQTGALSIFDWSTPGTPLTATQLTEAGMFYLYDHTAREYLYWSTPFTSTGDGLPSVLGYWNSEAGVTTGSQYVQRWANPTHLTSVAAIPGVSSAGRNSPRIMVGSDAGVTILDAKASDNTNGAKAYIDTGFSTSLLYGNVHLAFSPASSANLGNISAIFSTAETAVTRSATPNGPTSHAWAFNGTSSVSRVPDHDSLTFVAGNPMSIMLWAKVIATTHEQPLVSKRDDTSGSELREWSFLIASDEKLYYIQYDESTDAYIGRYYDTVLPLNQWVLLVGTYDGSGVSSGTKLWVNGAQVDNATVESGTFTAMENLTTPVTIGSRKGAGGNMIPGFADSLSGPQIVRGVIPKSVIEAEYACGLAAINSPTNDVLTSTNVLRVKAHPDGQYWGVLNASRLEVRDVHGALVDTFACTQCGTLADFAFAPVASDSFGVYLGGTTGYRAVIPDVRVEALAQYEWPDHSVFFDAEAVVVDSAGNGDFWRISDALDACGVVTARHVKVLQGTYNDPITVSAVKLLEGAGIKTLVTNINSTGDEPMTVSGDTVIVRDMAFRSASGGAGGNQDAVLWTGGYGIGENLFVSDADDDCYTLSGRWIRLINPLTNDCDDRGISFEGGRNSAITPVISSGGSSVVFIAAGDSNRVSGGDLSGNIHAASGATRNIIIGTIYGALEDYGTGTSEAGNP